MSELRERLRQRMLQAVRSRDRDTVVAIRSALAAMENAEAVSLPAQSGYAEARVGVGAGEASPRALPPGEEQMILRAEIDDLRRAAATYTRAGLPDRARTATRGADALAAVLS
jgi:hypothetical protein